MTSRPEQVWDAIERYVRAHGGTRWGPVARAVGGDPAYAQRRRDSMLEAGVLLNLAEPTFGERQGEGFRLWHSDDPRCPGK